MPILESTAAVLALWAVIGYLMGSIPFGMVLARAMGLGNLRDIGSGNIGATNVLRTGNKTAAALTLVLDGAKGAAALLLARALTGAEDAAQLAGLAAMIGHCYPIWLKFKGGKGVATFLGLLLALAWPVGIVSCVAWLVGAGMTRISSMGALLAASTSTFALMFMGLPSAMIWGAILTILVFWRHRENIKRIRAGTEPKIGKKSG
ncbi:glycerol-3-phosphate 1-O-acyltransferase PlsY [uncultured Tateyamaria sp.]|uniref:glycerol-3-phosphate 1-O-acyltransferase PlsY n=1 Tax=uncultured Tateyamaria sp. TaxID=455651 RepID=UPI0026145EA9|nr:glycerol-3-phosphate 1-O-acyltransferase PlsY [uncultured Tateyamaria sp.]